MKAIRHLSLVLVALLSVAACSKKEEAAKPAAPVVVLTAPTNNDSESWKAYFRQELGPYVDRRYRRPFTYFVPSVDTAAPDAADQQGLYDRQLENVQNAVARGIQAGSMIAFGGPDSARTGDMITESFKLAGPKSLKGVRVVVIASADQRARIEAAVTPTEADFVYLEPKL